MIQPRTTIRIKTGLLFILLLCCIDTFAQTSRTVTDFNKDWRFHLGDVATGKNTTTDDSHWRKLNLPHDWSIEGEFSKDHPAKPEGGALPGGIGWYRKTFNVPVSSKSKLVYIEFDGVYQKSTVWINGHELGFRPNGYIGFRYELTPYLHYDKPNIIAVKVDNSTQPNSRWYSGSGIYRNVRLITTNRVAISHWGTYITTNNVSAHSAKVRLTIQLNEGGWRTPLYIRTSIYNAKGKEVATSQVSEDVNNNSISINSKPAIVGQQFIIKDPVLWSVDDPHLYKAVSRVYRLKKDIKPVDIYTTTFGIRTFSFDKDKGFTLNGKPTKILGVCNHHDLGSLGAAFNTRAAERQLEMLKAMGCNAIRTSHNPPAPELLDLCDKMGFLVMDEAFDVWAKKKAEFDYHLYFNEWHERDLTDMLLRDRNHPSIVMWSVGNEIPEQGDTTGTIIAKKLAAIVRKYDDRPITTGNDKPWAGNFIVKSGAMDLVGINYHHWDFEKFHQIFPGQVFIGTETTSALQTRGHYDMPSDSIRRWPNNKEMKNGIGEMNADNTVSAYDNVSAPWGSTHEESWKLIKKHDYLSGMFIWTGFDYMGEPTPYVWPSRSSYFGIIDLAGFPKDIYYMYQSEWTDKPVLHIFPHWNWQAGKTVDVWAYYNNADEVELFLNGRSLGVRKKTGDDLHVMWRVQYEPGVLKAISRKNGKTVLAKEVRTAGAPAKIELSADRATIKADGKDLSFITARILDKDGNIVPGADNLLTFGHNQDAAGTLIRTDNGDPVSHVSFLSHKRKAFHGLALAIVQAHEKQGKIIFTASSPGLTPATIMINSR